jgi:hypothetical protein
LVHWEDLNVFHNYTELLPLRAEECMVVYDYLVNILQQAIITQQKKKVHDEELIQVAGIGAATAEV